jgi:hypothetical protein
MSQQKVIHSLSRRNFVLAALVAPFLANNLLVNGHSDQNISSSSSTDGEFIIVGGWVLLKSDLINTAG